MALYSCIECGKKVSSFAQNCPHCGCPVLRTLIGSVEMQKSNAEVEPEQDVLMTATDVADTTLELPTEYLFDQMDQITRDTFLAKVNARMRPLGIFALLALLSSIVVAVVFAILHEQVYFWVGLAVFAPLFVCGVVLSALYWKKYASIRTDFLRKLSIAIEKHGTEAEAEELDEAEADQGEPDNAEAKDEGRAEE